MSMALQLCCIYFKLNNAVGSKCYLDVDFSSLTQISYSSRSEQNRTEILFVKTCTYIHHHTIHLILLYTRDIQL